MSTPTQKIKETQIQTAICDYLAHKKLFFWRQNTGGMFRDNRWFAMPKYSKKGIPDILLVKDGLFIGLEVKRPKGRQSDHQKAFEQECKKAGGQYYIITSVEDVQKLGF